MLKLRAYAKINLTLDILGQRPDGYHDIASVLQTIDMADRLTFQDAESLTLVCNVPALSGEDNLVMKAATLLAEEVGCVGGASVRLTKGIPLAAGLGGGSSDAAATLVGLNTLWQLGLPRADLLGLASRLGADVPFFLWGGTALVEGRGEAVTPLPSLGERWVVLLKPPAEMAGKTAKLYGALQPGDFTTGAATRRLADLIREGGEPESNLLSNGFERCAAALFPGLAGFRERFLAGGAPRVVLTGSGPTLYCLLNEKATAERIFENLRRQGMKVYLARTVGPRDGGSWPN
ncbi:MAG: 4-(cytidine 5'-diphospho)-2-C-methyl-D-erythritol kinase [Chloroflexi bacterium]|nr:4-(cytidine 5'-diphospho)-2-C-methyl-D-erythritol kinase [Chloroflexota bacterium]